MNVYRIKLMEADGEIFIIDVAPSQLHAIMEGVDFNTTARFWNQEQIDLPNGGKLKLLRTL